MEAETVWVALGSLFPLILLAKNVNWWFYERKLGKKQSFLPPGDLGWPFIGNMRSFLSAFHSDRPDSFLASIVSRYEQSGIYRAFMFGSPCVIVTSPETCKRVLMDDDNFQPGWPKSTMKLIGEKSFIGISAQEHKRLRRLTAAPINGHEALSMYTKYIEESVIASLEKWSEMGEIKFLTQLRKLTFRVIMYIFLSSESEPVMETLEREYTRLNYGVRAMAINLPGFAYHNALKARRNLVSAFQSIVTERRNRKTEKRDMMDALLEAEDENGRKLSDEEIIDVLLMYINAGHESSGHITMWATIFLQDHPQCFKKAKEEQEGIIKRRPSTQKGLCLKDLREMEYLSKGIDETLRLITFSLVVFRQAKADVKINDQVI